MSILKLKDKIFLETGITKSGLNPNLLVTLFNLKNGGKWLFKFEMQQKRNILMEKEGRRGATHSDRMLIVRIAVYLELRRQLCVLF